MKKNSKKYIVVISKCLLGENVRYDGNNKLDKGIIDFFSKYVEFIPVCPEVDCGLGVPRIPMDLYGDYFQSKIISKDGRDYTNKLAFWIKEWVKCNKNKKIDAFIVKSKSPSCGLNDVEIMKDNGVSIKSPTGLFPKTLKIEFPSIPIKDEIELQDLSEKEKLLKLIKD